MLCQAINEAFFEKSASASTSNEARDILEKGVQGCCLS